VLPSDQVVGTRLPTVPLPTAPLHPAAGLSLLPRRLHPTIAADGFASAWMDADSDAKGDLRSGPVTVGRPRHNVRAMDDADAARLGAVEMARIADGADAALVPIGDASGQPRIESWGNCLFPAAALSWSYYLLPSKDARMALPLAEIGRRIRSLREQLGLSARELANALGTTVQIVENLETGVLDPLPGDYILIVARLLKTDFRYFISTDLDDVEEETRHVFRAVGQRSPEDRLAIRRFVYFCLCASELEEILSVPKLPLPPIYPQRSQVGWLHKTQGAEAARIERERLGLGDRPIENIFEILRLQGVRLLRHRLQESELSGLTALHPRAGVCILVNYDEDLCRQFFSAAHEYGHVLFDRGDIQDKGCLASFASSKRERVEIRANYFAREFLLPEAALNRYARPRSLEELRQRIEQIARDYRVNTETVAILMKHKGWITERTLKSFQKVRPVVIPRRNKTDPDIPAGLSASQVERRTVATEHGLSSYYLELLRRGLIENAISFGRFAEMLDMLPAEAAEFVKQVGLAT
jgi:Zn-dependent peptidase ImmA (M78 family)/transcriptional regulator with XRE-family HTH domain